MSSDIKIAEKTYSSQRGIKFYYRLWAPIGALKGVIVGIHGYAEHSGRYSHVGEFLASNGYAFYMQDLRGHGKSEGERGYIDKFSDFVDDVLEFTEMVMKENNVDKVFLFGHSMGGLIATIFAIEHGDILRGLILSGPALATSIEIKGPRLALLKLLAKIRPKYRPEIVIDPSLLTNDPKVNEAYVKDPLVFKRGTIRLLDEMLKAMNYALENAHKITVPVLILHGKEDKIVPPTASQELYERIASQDKELILMEGIKHEVLNDIKKEEALRKIVEWLNNH
ncbi:MAG: lysophospholipase [Candidatus Njordarchaeales archaeon]